MNRNHQPGRRSAVDCPNRPVDTSTTDHDPGLRQRTPRRPRVVQLFLFLIALATPSAAQADAPGCETLDEVTFGAMVYNAQAAIDRAAQLTEGVDHVVVVDRSRRRQIERMRQIVIRLEHIVQMTQIGRTGELDHHPRALFFFEHVHERLMLRVDRRRLELLGLVLLLLATHGLLGILDRARRVSVVLAAVFIPVFIG